MALTTYRKKRSFPHTPEPAGGKSAGKQLHFVVQKHDASHLHYDFRLEMDGVLKSWAVPKGPSTDPSVKRLAMMVEDHPYDYLNFEGVIPKGQYGGGTVMVWDKGVYEPAEGKFTDKRSKEKALLSQLRKGKIVFVLKGKKLKGEYALVKSSFQGKNSWLLIKAKDKYARAADITKKVPRSGERKTLLNPQDKSQVFEVNGHELQFTNLSKIYWPKEKIAKRELINYYYQAAPYILPYLKGRPQSLNRFPNGINGQSFYQKDVTGKIPDWIDTFPYRSQDEDKDKNFMVCNDEAALLYMVNLGCIEINPWSSTVKKPDNPDWCIIDLDPGKRTVFEQVIEAAKVTGELLEKAGVACYPKTSGSTGIHIYIPLGAAYSYDQSKEFARLIVTLVHQQIPEFTSIERSVSGRKGKMYLDFLQNRPQATLAAPYSVRPKPGATVSMPLHWDELKKGLTMQDFTIQNTIGLLKKRGDLFKPVLGKGINMKKAMEKLEKI